MQNLRQNNLPLDVALFEVEELEERLENKWGTCKEGEPTTVQAGDCQTKEIRNCQ